MFFSDKLLVCGFKDLVAIRVIASGAQGVSILDCVVAEQSNALGVMHTHRKRGVTLSSGRRDTVFFNRMPFLGFSYFGLCFCVYDFFGGCVLFGLSLIPFFVAALCWQNAYSVLCPFSLTSGTLPLSFF